MSANRWSGISEEAAAEIEAALARRNKIDAIKIYREATNCGLKEAKDAVEAVEGGGVVGTTRDQGNDLSGVGREVRKRSGSSWLTMVLVLVVVGVILAAVLLAMR